MVEVRLLQVGTVDGTPIYADVTVLGSAVPVGVVLLQDYAMQDPPSYPFRPSFTGAATPQYPHTVSAGTSLLLLACEAAALVNAGAAAYQ